MTGRPPADDDRDLDRWVQEVTDGWRVQPLRPGVTAWHERVTGASRRRWRLPGAFGAVAAGVAGIALVGVVAFAVLLATAPRTPGPGGAPGTQVAVDPTAAPSSPGQSPIAVPTENVPPPTEPVPLPTHGPLPLDIARDDLFSLTIVAVRRSYPAGEPIEIATVLSYIGDAEETMVTGSGSGLVAFDIEQLDGPIDQQAVRTADCAQHVYQRGDEEDVPFQKSGSSSPDDSMADFWREFFADPELRLPAGEYRISAVALYGAPECGDERTLTASITIVVE